MRLARRIYWSFLDTEKYLNIGNILLDVDGALIDAEDLPNSFFINRYGLSKEDFMLMIEDQISDDLYNNVNNDDGE